MTIVPDTIFRFYYPFFLTLFSRRRTSSTKPQNELPSALADSERERRGDGAFYAYEIPTLPTYLHYRKQHREGFLRAHCIVPAFSIVLPPTRLSSTPPSVVTTILLHFSF